MTGHRHPGRGPVVAIGGAEDKLGQRAILRRVVALSGGEEAVIAVIPTASRLEDTGQRYERAFLDLGARKVHVLPIVDRHACEDPACLDVLEQATGVFMTGGNQLRLSSVIGGTEVARTLRRRNREGQLVAGTSAGAAFVSEHMIAYGQEGATPRAGMVSVVPGLGLLNQVIVDQHFRQRDRLGRLLTALAYNPFAVGLGLDEDTAVFVDGDDRMQVVGRGAVTVLDARSLEHAGVGLVREGEPVSLTGLTLHVLVDGGTFDIPTREARPADVDRAHLREADADVKGLSDEERALDEVP